MLGSVAHSIHDFDRDDNVKNTSETTNECVVFFGNNGWTNRLRILSTSELDLYGHGGLSLCREHLDEASIHRTLLRCLYGFYARLGALKQRKSRERDSKEDSGCIQLRF